MVSLYPSLRWNKIKTMNEITEVKRKKGNKVNGIVQINDRK
ncbi:MAG: hypothetical protein ACTS5A_00985 [Candidatus Hodgkinia cicadicola]